MADSTEAGRRPATLPAEGGEGGGAPAERAGAVALPVHPSLRLLAAPDSAAADEALSPLLGPADHRRAAVRRNAEARRRTRIGRGLVRLLAARFLGIPPERVVTGASPGGAPYARAPGPRRLSAASEAPRSATDALRSSPGTVAVSVTHTRGLVVATASDRADRLGVDVERLDRKTRPEAIARRHFLDPEIQTLLALPEPERVPAFLRAWTLKESWGKAAGVAVPTALTRIAFDLAPSRFPTAPAPVEHRPLSVSAPSRLPPTSRWRFWTTTHTGFTLAVTAGYRAPASDLV